ncbi:hypothetical protein IX307_001596 [Bacteroides pyogenes]|nr:hypothetical protein [Bacteroides pyogenes]MBR8721446.1 hypothetical protein [Bacteroides pyogenes]MBR8724722.1 hypothetical protein [Bacteroides pyogenes]MBR8738190.1 hypothetical protein [Bacteroides pyogenes]MBR8753861.1 hypothetical protein [Bacteroides pyogenes]
MKKLGLTYTDRISTNGYLLTQDVINELPSPSIRPLQTTIDGMSDLHYSRRCLNSGKPPFERIIKKNIDTLQA